MDKWWSLIRQHSPDEIQRLFGEHVANQAVKDLKRLAKGAHRK